MTANPFLEALLHIQGDRDDLLLAGGVAAALYGVNRATFDIDLIPRPDPEAWRSLVRTLVALGYRPRLPLTTEELEDLERLLELRSERNLLAVTFAHPDEPIEVDLLIGFVERFQELANDRVTLTLEGRKVHLVSPEALVRLKRESGRPQDLADAEQLERLLAERR